MVKPHSLISVVPPFDNQGFCMTLFQECFAIHIQLYKTGSVPIQRLTQALHIPRWKLWRISNSGYEHLWYCIHYFDKCYFERGYFRFSYDLDSCLNRIHRNDNYRSIAYGSPSAVTRSWKPEAWTQVSPHYKVPLILYIHEIIKKTLLKKSQFQGYGTTIFFHHASLTRQRFRRAKFIYPSRRSMILDDFLN